MVSSEWITKTERLKDLYPEWEALFCRCGGASPFLHPRWVKGWWEHFGGGATLRLLILREEGRLEGIVPLQQRWSRWRFFPVRSLSLLQNGQSRPGFLLAKEREKWMPEVIGALEQTSRQWDLFLLDCVEAEEQRLFANSASAKLKVVDASEWSDSSLHLEGDWESYLQSKTAKFRKTLRYTDNVLSREGTLRWEMSRGEAVGPALELFLELDQRSWKREGGEYILGDVKLAGFYRQTLLDLAESGAGGIFLLWSGERPIAGTICLFSQGTLYTLKTSFDEALAKFSPGTVLFHHLIEHAYESGCRLLDFVGKIPFSQRWTDQSRSFQRWVVTNQNPYSHALGEMKRLALRWRSKYGAGEVKNWSEPGREVSSGFNES
jgi:CelD/BcsL family acetyltransferase involved in cellulose biosynthesis